MVRCFDGTIWSKTCQSKRQPAVEQVDPAKVILFGWGPLHRIMFTARHDAQSTLRRVEGDRRKWKFFTESPDGHPIRSRTIREQQKYPVRLHQRFANKVIRCSFPQPPRAFAF